MCQLFESIRIENGMAHNLEFHQKRINQSLEFLNSTKKINLNHLISKTELPIKGIHKLRISYNTKGVIQQSIKSYKTKQIRSVKLVACNSIEYNFKYEDRSTINQLLEDSKADEIIITKDGIITDSSISNILFYDGNNWITPSTPLLEGTQRALLLKRNKIKKVLIKIVDLNKYSEFCFINALNDFEKSKSYPISMITA